MANLEEEKASLKRMANKIFVGGKAPKGTCDTPPGDRWDLWEREYIPFDYSSHEKKLAEEQSWARWIVDHRAIYMYCSCGYTFVRRRDSYASLNRAAAERLPYHQKFGTSDTCPKSGGRLKPLPQEIHCQGCSLLVGARFDNHGVITTAKHNNHHGKRCYNGADCSPYYQTFVGGEEQEQLFYAYEGDPWASY